MRRLLFAAIVLLLVPATLASQTRGVAPRLLGFDRVRRLAVSNGHSAKRRLSQHSS